MPVVDAIGDLCGDAVKTAIQTYQKLQNSASVFTVFYTLMDWARVHKTSGCFVEAYLSVGFTAGLGTYL